MNAPANAIAKSAPAANQLRATLNTDGMKKQLMMALPKVLPVDRFLRALFTTMNRDPKLAECEKESVLAGVMTAAQLGLEIDPTLGRAYLLPYRDAKKGLIAQLIIGYRGYVDLFYRSGQGSGLLAEAVYEKDHFEYSLGLDPKLHHIPADDDDRGRLKYAYAVATLSNGGKVWRVLNRSLVMKAKKASRGSDSQYSPWNTFEEEMWRKTAIRAVSKLLPLSPELRDAVAMDEDDEAQQARAFASAIDVPATVSSEAAVGEDTPAPSQSDPMATLTPRQRVNALMLEVGQLGAGNAAAIVVKRHGEPSKLDDAALRVLADELASIVRSAVEGQGG